MCHLYFYHTVFLEKNKNGIRYCLGTAFGLLYLTGIYNFDSGSFLFHTDV